MIRKATISLLAVCLTSIAYWFWQSNQIKLAPEINLTTITGKNIQLAQLKGRPVIINFWATDCKSCIEEIPHLIELYKQYHPKGLEIVAITMYYDPPSHVVSMTKAKKIPYHVALDLKADHANAFGQIELTPTTLLISPSGHIVMHTTGKFDINDMKQQLNKFTG